MLDIPAWAASHVKQLATVSIHSYPNTHCNNHTVTTAMLLSDSATQNEAAYLTKIQLAANLSSLSLPLVMGEGNDVSCGGMPGVSNSYASAIWAVDTLFNLATAGVRAHNFHGGGSYLGSYSAFVFANDTTEVVTVQPLFYAMHLFALATRDYPHTVSTSVQHSTNNAIKLHTVWNGQRASTVIVHKQHNANQSATVSLTYTPPTAAANSSAAFAFPIASVYRLSGASIQTEFDVDLSGATWRGSRDGRLVGQVAPQMVKPVDGKYVVTVPPGTVVLVQWEMTVGSGGGVAGGSSGAGFGAQQTSAASSTRRVPIAHCLFLLAGLAILLL